MTLNHRQLLRAMFDAAVSATSPMLCVPPLLPKPPKGRTLVIGAGKAAASMAAAVEAHWPWPLDGLVVTRYGHSVPCSRIKVIEAAHPVPDAAGLEAARAVLSAASSLGPDDLLLCLISGGGSSLLTLPAGDLTLADKQEINLALLKSGAHIGEMNTVRKHLSAIKGGRLAIAAHPARVSALVISDVPGDDPSVIASGPTSADRTTSAEALIVLRKYGIETPASVLDHLADPSSESPKAGDFRLANVETTLVATPQMALEAAARVAKNAGFAPVILGNAIQGEAREVGTVHAGIALQCASYGQPREIPCALISGGETTVTMRGSGRGGRNAEFLLSLGLALDGHHGIAAMAADTDGIDGSEDNAGALLVPDTLARAASVGIDAKAHLAANDAYALFAAIGDLVLTGPTLTNVNDFRAILVFART